jgi:DNA-binding beta-propeller fold protein YncE
MLKRQLSPRQVAIATIIVLAIVQGIYWRLLVYRPPTKPTPVAGGGPAAPTVPGEIGRQDVLVDTLAGGQPGYEDGPGWKARLNGPSALALEPGGTILVADSRNHRIRRVTDVGKVTTVAGSGPSEGMGGRADGPVEQARFRYPSGVAVGPAQEIYVSDTGNHRICRIAGGQVSTVTDALHAPGPLTWQDGTLWVADVAEHRIDKVDPAAHTVSAGAAPPAVTRALGDLAERTPERAMVSCDGGQGEVQPSHFKLGRRAPAWGEGGSAPQLFADPVYHVLLLELRGSAPLLLAGRRVGKVVVTGTRDGEGHRSDFVLPCGVVTRANGTAYVADAEGNRIRRVRLPEWARVGDWPPARGARRWRDWNGR